LLAYATENKTAETKPQNNQKKIIQKNAPEKVKREISSSDDEQN